ncbi:MAG: hypothetical protein JWO85_2652 [Candidatus Eremiobacteraeota bacterium]|nr:hypothetical protein [Candidatus Eremiobacteraeota bacterium]
MTAHQLRRVERAENRADRRYQQGAALVESARRAAQQIPFGQPILVGHHSERRDRNYRSRYIARWDKGSRLLAEARDLDSAARGAGRAIMSDDPEAIDALTAKLAKLKDLQDKMKSTNRAVRLKDRAKGRAALSALGYPDAAIVNLYEPVYGRIGVPSYALTNNGANIRRIEERIAALKRAAVTPAMEPVAGDGWTITEDVDDCRIAIRFDAKPDRPTLKALASAGFRWSPTRGAHVRQRSNGAIYAAKRVLGVSQ